MDYIKYKHINNYGDNYIIFNTGKIISKHTGKFLYLTKSEHPQQRYEQVKLFKNGKAKTTTVHKLVANHFIENTHNLPTVDHINRDRYDNKACNLRWASYKKQTFNRKINKRNNTGHRGIQYNQLSDRIVINYHNDDGEAKKTTLRCNSIHGDYEDTLKLAIEFKNQHQYKVLY
jgi:hypothetical protein